MRILTPRTFGPVDASDTVPLPSQVRTVTVGSVAGGAVVVVENAAGDTVAFDNVQVGEVLSIPGARFIKESSTASSFVIAPAGPVVEGAPAPPFSSFIEPNFTGIIKEWNRADGQITLVGDRISNWGETRDGEVWRETTQDNNSKRFEFISDFGDGNGPAVRFDGIDDATANASGDDFLMGVTWVEWVLFRNRSSAPTVFISEHGPNSSAGDGSRLVLEGSTDKIISQQHRGAVESKVRTGVITEAFDGTWILLRHQIQGTSATHKIFINGVEVSVDVLTLGSPSASFTDRMRLGSRAATSFFAAIDLRERLVVTDPSGLPAVEDLEAADEEIALRWGVTLL